MFAMEPGVFMGVGQRLVPLDAARGGNQNNRPIGDLAGKLDLWTVNMSC